MSDAYRYDVFLSHSSQDKPIVRPLAERLRQDGVKVWYDDWEIIPGDSIPAKIEEGLEHSRVLVLFMSANAFGSDWAKLESGTFRFRDPLNKDRRFLPLRLDDAPLKGSLAQFLHIEWKPDHSESDYIRFLEACLSPAEQQSDGIEKNQAETQDRHIQFKFGSVIWEYSFSRDGKHVLAASRNRTIKLWDVETGTCLMTMRGHKGSVWSVAWSADGQQALSCGDDMTLRLWNVNTGVCLRTIHGHRGRVFCIDWNADQQRAISGSEDNRMRLWDLETGRCLRTFIGHTAPVWIVALSPDQTRAISGSADESIRMWNLESGDCMHIFTGHMEGVRSLAWSPDGKRFASGSYDNTVRIWDVESGCCTHLLEGHTGNVISIAWNEDHDWIITGSYDSTVRLWDTHTGQCLHIFEGHTSYVCSLAWHDSNLRFFSGDRSGRLHRWNVTQTAHENPPFEKPGPTAAPHSNQTQYLNAKVLVVGDTHAGKTGLTHRLATGEWRASEESTVGAWCTQWPIKDISTGPDVDREIWLWDFGGQADQRIIHQLYLERTALILLLFDADQEDVLPGLRDWLTALRRCVKDPLPHFIVAGRVDTGFKASRGKLQKFAEELGHGYHETSAKTGEGCEDLKAALIEKIQWPAITTSPRIFKRIKDEILKLRDEEQVLHTYKELRELLWQRLPDEPRFDDSILKTVISLLDSPGVVKELHYGTYILLAPEWINAYGQAVIRTLRSADNELGTLPLRSIEEGKLVYQSIGRNSEPTEMKRLPPAEEKVVLGEMERQLEERRLCLRQGDKLVFPSHCGRDRPAVLKHPSVFVSYAVTGFLDDIYATLVVKLAASESFQMGELWRDAADFVTLTGECHMGIKLTRDSGSQGEISVYFGNGVDESQQVIFANYIHRHLDETCETKPTRLRHYVCPHCNEAKGNPSALVKRLLAKKQEADTECDACGDRFPLWDLLEKKFASIEVRQQVEALLAEDLIKLTTRRQGKLLVLDVGARITSANQKWMEVPGDEDDGIDILVEFTDDDGNGIGDKGLCLQLKAGNSHLTTRKSDGVEIFKIKKQRWVHTWMNQRFPVMLVIGTLPQEDKHSPRREKQEFTDVRWMEISSELRVLSGNGTKPVTQIEFKGERLDLSSVRRWRDRIVNG